MFDQRRRQSYSKFNRSDLIYDTGLCVKLVDAGGGSQLDGRQVSMPEAAEEVERWVGADVLADADLTGETKKSQ